MPEIFDSAQVEQPNDTNGTVERVKRDLATGSPTAPTDQIREFQQKTHHRPVEEYSETMRFEPASRSSVSAFIAKPKNIRFSSQNIEENIILILRQALITQVGWVVGVVLLSLLPFILSGFGFSSYFGPGFRVAVMLGWYLLLMGYSFESFLRWFYNVYIITDERIIDIDFHSLIYRSISAAKIDNIEDTTARTGGFFPSLFNYGTITIQTAAEKREFEFDRVPQPDKILKVIDDLILEEEREKYEGRVN